MDQCVYRCIEVEKRVSELQERTEVATNIIATFRIALQTLFDRMDRLERQVSDLLKGKSSKIR